MKGYGSGSKMGVGEWKSGGQIEVGKDGEGGDQMEGKGADRGKQGVTWRVISKCPLGTVRLETTLTSYQSGILHSLIFSIVV